MPLPKTPLTITGGCNCRSIRYKLTIPEFSERPLNFYCDPAHKKDENRLPFVTLDHCNDCRRAIGSLINAWICCPAAFMTVALTPRSSVHPTTKEVTPDESLGDSDRIWIPASTILVPGAEENADSWLTFYQSSAHRMRSFCGKCGTSLFYEGGGPDYPPEWPAMIDIILATVDRAILETEDLRPERQIWCNYGVGWALRLVADGKGCEDLPRHPIWKINELVE